MYSKWYLKYYTIPRVIIHLDSVGVTEDSLNSSSTFSLDDGGLLLGWNNMLAFSNWAFCICCKSINTVV